MRFQIVTLPDVVDGGFTDALAFRHQPATPMRHPLMLAAQRRIDDRLHLLRTIGGVAAASGSDLPQPIQAFLLESRSPQNDGVAIHRQLSRNGAVGLSGGRGQYDAASQGNLLRCSKSRNPLAQLVFANFVES